MNYYNPYFLSFPYSYTPTIQASRGLLGGLFGGGRLSSIINGTQKTLGIVNQAIPIVKQISPVMKNAKTMFKVMNEFKRVDKPTNNTSKVQSQSVNNSDNNQNIQSEEVNQNQIESSNRPTFFL